MFGTNLFHSVDFNGDSGKLWLGNTTGPGGSCHVFTFYNKVQSEAIQMIRGLGMYVRRMYRTRVAQKMVYNKPLQSNSRLVLQYNIRKVQNTRGKTKESKPTVQL